MASARKPLSFGINACYLKDGRLIVPEEEGTANSVPAAAVIPGVQTLLGIIGRKAHVGGHLSRM